MSEPTTERIEDLYSYATAWESEPEDPHVRQMQANARAEFRHWLAAHDERVRHAERKRLHAGEEVKLGVEGDWLVRYVNKHTCGTGPDGHYGHHEPGCGSIPVMSLDEIQGWRRDERATP
ncbi:hypothetical protein LQF12_02295 [Ruania suaedae]|uniref:hypothetical protein n=1 Tax=Ruania suaedae TaxID=2897774 RepID=UPI001E3EFB1B|nr:hypothetical protein [Ruania suaedae]UFU03463.1 hypothetical protein LQF12_02295 [Ruania suaedae]